MRPRFRLPIWAALAIAGAAYLVRSIVIRGGDFRPDLPSDAVVLVAFVVVIALVAQARHAARESEPHDLPNDVERKDGV